MTDKSNRIQCNMYLTKKSVDTVKDFTKGTGLTFSFYIDSLISRAAEHIEYYFIKIPPKAVIQKGKSPQSEKIRCNMILDKRSVFIVKEKLKEKTITFSSYIDYFVRNAEKRILEFYNSKNIENILQKADGGIYYNVYQMQKILGLIDSDPGSPFLNDEQIKADLYSTKPFSATEVSTSEELKRK